MTRSLRGLATTAREFDPAEIGHGHVSDTAPPVALAALPLAVVIGVNLLMSWSCCRAWTPPSSPRSAGA